MAEQRQRQRQLGRAPSTIRVDGSVINFYNTFRALKGKTTTFEQIIPAEIENDNLENEMVDLMYFCSDIGQWSTLVPGVTSRVNLGIP